MQTLYIDQSGIRLDYERATLVLYQQGVRQTTVPLNQIGRVVLSPSAEIAAGVLGVLAEHRVALMVVNHRYPERTATLSGIQHGKGQRRLAQYRYLNDADMMARGAARLVAAKLGQQQRVLCRLRALRPDQRRPLTHAIERLHQARVALRGSTTPVTVASLHGIEGAAAAAYFQALVPLFPPALGFTQRQSRPPRDGVNALLSLGYTLLQHEAVLALRMAGLDPLLGLYHTLSHGRDSLACDLIEPLRPLLDEWVWSLFALHGFRSEDFSRQGEAVVLQPAAKRRFYSAYHAFAPRLLARLRHLSHFGVRILEAQHG